MSREEKSVSVERIFLHNENPRHKRLETQAQIISQLCKHEQVAQLARDIVKHGLNPLERFALFIDENSTDAAEPNYVVAEGNRRMCALKLLNDPDLAPSEIRKDFEKLSERWDAIGTVPAIIFDDDEDLHLWRTRTHQGFQGGVGRKDWSSEQRQRNSGTSKNRVAQQLLDYAQETGLISGDDRQRKLTTVSRFVSNPLIREALGLVISDPEELQRNRTEDDFKLLVKKFVEDLTAETPKIHSRANKDAIDGYARELVGTEGQSRTHVDAQPLKAEIDKPIRSPRPKKPKAHSEAKKVPFEQDIQAILAKLQNRKLISLYRSICEISLPENVPLLAVGVWSFLETLTACAGRADGNSFDSFFNNDRLTKYGYAKKQKSAATIRDVVARIGAFGNSTKHHGTAALFSGDQLANDVETLKDVIVACANEALAKATKKEVAE